MQTRDSTREGRSALQARPVFDDEGHSLAEWEARAQRGGSSAERVALRLGWLSVGLGVTQLVAPGWMASWIGVRDDRRTRWTLRAVGLREVVTGIGILSRPRPSNFVWARSVGDLMDLVLLGASLKSGAAIFDGPSSGGARRTSRGRLYAAGLTAKLAVIDVLTALKLSRERAASSVGHS